MPKSESNSKIASQNSDLCCLWNIFISDKRCVVFDNDDTSNVTLPLCGMWMWILYTFLSTLKRTIDPKWNEKKPQHKNRGNFMGLLVAPLIAPNG